MALLSKLLIPVIAGLSLMASTASYAQEVTFKYKVGDVVSTASNMYYGEDRLGYSSTGEVVEVGVCNEEIRKLDPDSDCHETHWYKLRVLHWANYVENVYALTNDYVYCNQKNILNYIGVLEKIKKYE